MDTIKEGQHVLVILNESEDEVLKSKLESKNSYNTFMSYEQFFEYEFQNSSYDAILTKFDSQISYSDGLLSKILNIQKPGSAFIILNSSEEPARMEFNLKINGFINIFVKNDEIVGSKPNYEIGSSTKLHLSAKPVKAVWKLDDTVDEDVEMIDPDNLLDEDDLKKPDPSSLKVCATTGKRKACKDCSCGLAEELAADTKGVAIDTAAPKSSCGSCYLGDAFRCATCPYLGMPAFKPGEKIALTNNQLKADI